MAAMNEFTNNINVRDASNPANHLLIVVPANNEQLTIENCLRHLLLSREQLSPLLKMRTHIVVVCDSCTDATASLANDLLCPWRDSVVACQFTNVGRARALGAQVAWKMIEHESLRSDSVWYAFTDADTGVPADWLQRHLHHLQAGSHSALGIVQIDSDDPVIRHHFDRDYQIKLHDTGHSHIHGANMGVRADYYWAAGGFPALRAHEDRYLVHNLRAKGARVMRDKHLIVTTSHRVVGRAPAGFAHHLRELHQTISSLHASPA